MVMRIPAEVKAFTPNQGSVAFPPTDNAWFTFMAWHRSETNTILGQLFDGKITSFEFADKLHELLIRSHESAQLLGRQRAGVLHGLDETDRQVALFHLQEQGSFLAGFSADLVDKKDRYWDSDKQEWKKGAVARRAQMYGSRLRGTASIAFETNSPGDSWFYWRLGAAEHCEDCIDLAARSPWKKGELPVFPGDGGTECLVNCKCHLERDDGVKSFPPDSGVGKAEAGEDENNKEPDEKMDTTSRALFSGSQTILADDDVDDAIESVFGALLGHEEIANIVAAPAGSQVQLFNDYDNLRVEVRKPSWGLAYTRTFFSDGTVRHDVLQARSAPPLTGTRIVARQLVMYHKHGLTQVEVHAAKGAGWNGYYLWPAMGFDCQVDEDTSNLLEEHFGITGVSSTHELAKELGEAWREWWKVYGHDTHGEFDLEGETYSWQLFVQYLALKEIYVGQNDV